MSRRRRNLIAVVALMLIAGAGLWQLRQPRTDDAARASEPKAAAASMPTSQAQAAPAQTTPAGAAGDEPLPSPLLPLPQRLPTLERLAEAGHPEARCQLVVERLRCAFLRNWKPEPADNSRESRLEAQGQLEAANQAALDTLRRIEQRAECEATPPVREIESLRLLGRAAAAGHAPSAVLYFQVGQELRSQRGIFQHPEFDAWRRDAARFLHAAADQGQPEAVRALGRAYWMDGTFSDGLIANDPARAYLYLRLAARLSGSEWSPRTDEQLGLDAAARARLQAEADRLHRERFGGRQYERRELEIRGPFRQPHLDAGDFCGPPKPL